ncbi:MAG: ABC transporter ATP-binding protein [Alphaproteobacteria bacterium]
MAEQRERGPGASSAARYVAPEPWRDPAAKPFISLRGVTKRFGRITAVDNVDLDVYRGELFALLGGSGCGKTTLLRMLAGFETPSAGTIAIDGADMSGIPPYERPVNLMFQSYALFPHMSVAANVGFGLKQAGMVKADVAARVGEMLALVQLDGFDARKPHQLSGGQQQRVALARALAPNPKLLLLDEPLGALDRKLREQTQFELVAIQEKIGVTFMVVTHDQEEAMTLSSRIGVMDAGRIVQIGKPEEIYEYPASRFVADFIGSVNLFEGRIVATGVDGTTVESEEAGGRFYVATPVDADTGTACAVAIRPEKIRLLAEAPSEIENAVAGRVDEIAYLGNLSIFQVALANGRMVRVTRPNLTRSRQTEFTWDQDVWLAWDASSPVVLLS